MVHYGTFDTISECFMAVMIVMTYIEENIVDCLETSTLMTNRAIEPSIEQ